MTMIPLSQLTGNNFLKARILQKPVVALSPRTFRVTSASSSEAEHLVGFDSADEPHAASCTCEAARHGQPCWAIARALDCLTLLAVHQIYIGTSASAEPPALAPDTALVARMAAVEDNVEMFLATSGAIKRATAPQLAG